MNSGAGDRTEIVQAWVEKLRAGDQTAREELINCACDRLMKLTRTVKKNFDRVNRWEQTEDIFQRATMRLYQSLQEVELNDARHFFRLAALQIRRELLDLARHYGGPQGLGAHHATQMVNPEGSEVPHAAYEAADATGNPENAAEWGDFHDAVESLPDDQREVVELLFYHGLSQDEAAHIMEVSVRTIKRYWRTARLALHEKLQGDFPNLE